MPEATLTPTDDTRADGKSALVFYTNVLRALTDAGLPFLVGGAYALSYYTGISRHTKDLDIFICREDYERISETLQKAGYTTKMTYPHWLAKVRLGEELVDLIFSSGNGISAVDPSWFDRAPATEVLGVQVRICAVEETIWSKAFVMERERYDGADIAHLLRACAPTLDWMHLLALFGPHWRVLLSHLTLFGFSYPAQRDLIPAWAMEELVERLRQEIRTRPDDEAICAGTLLSREQYLVDVEEHGYRDARLSPLGNMTPDETALWTGAIQSKH